MQATKKFSKRHKFFSHHNNVGFTQFQFSVYKAVMQIPRGRVATYEDVACLIGKSRAARAVGNALNHNTFSDVPCHRVVRSDGAVGGYAWGRAEKMLMLRREGVSIINSRIDLKLYGTKSYS